MNVSYIGSLHKKVSAKLKFYTMADSTKRNIVPDELALHDDSIIFNEDEDVDTQRNKVFAEYADMINKATEFDVSEPKDKPTLQGAKMLSKMMEELTTLVRPGAWMV